MKKYKVKYRYSRYIESSMIVTASSPEEAKAKAGDYCIDYVISVKEI